MANQQRVQGLQNPTFKQVPVDFYESMIKRLEMLVQESESISLHKMVKKQIKTPLQYSKLLQTLSEKRQLNNLNQQKVVCWSGTGSIEHAEYAPAEVILASVNPKDLDMKDEISMEVDGKKYPRTVEPESVDQHITNIVSESAPERNHHLAAANL